MTDWTPEARLDLAARLWEWTPHPGQRELLTLRGGDGREPRVLVAACGRRWGKTEALACDIAARILTDTGLGQMGVAPTRDQAGVLFDAVEEKIRDAQENEAARAEFPHLAALEIRRTPYPLIRRKDTGVVVFSVRTAGRNGANLRGRGTTRKLARFRVVIDERAFVPDEAVERAIKPMLATVPNGGGQLVEISSPSGRRGGFYDDFVRGERGDGRYRAVRLPSSQNPLVDKEFLAEMRAEMTERAFRSEFLAEFTDGVGAVFPDDDIARAATIADDYGDAPLWNVRYVAGVDFGRRGDWTVVAICAANNDGTGLRLVTLLRMQGLRWDGQIEAVADALQKWGVVRVVADRTGVGDPLTESLASELALRRVPCEVEPFVFSAYSKAQLIDGLAIALGRDRLRFPPHPVLLSELRNFEISETPTGQETTGAKPGAHDDTVCALALAWRAGGPFLAAQAGPVALGAASATGRVRTEKKEIDFRCEPGFKSSPAAEKMSGWHRPIRAFPSRLLISAYRFAPARAAGALVHRWLRRPATRR